MEKRFLIRFNIICQCFSWTFLSTWSVQFQKMILQIFPINSLLVQYNIQSGRTISTRRGWGVNDKSPAVRQNLCNHLVLNAPWRRSPTSSPLLRHLSEIPQSFESGFFCQSSISIVNALSTHNFQLLVTKNLLYRYVYDHLPNVRVPHSEIHTRLTHLLRREAITVMKMWHSVIPHICHQYHQYICGEKSFVWRHFRFLNVTDAEKSEFSPHVGKFIISPQFPNVYLKLVNV